MVFIRVNSFNKASNWSLYRSRHAHLARKKMAEDITDTVSSVPKMPEIPPRKSDRYAKWVFWYLSYIMSSYKHWNVECVGDWNNHPLIDWIKLVVFSHWYMVTESIMKWVFWYLSYIISSYKHWNVECVWDNRPFILHLLVAFYILVYWLILDVLTLVVFYTLVYWLIKSWNGCFDINSVLCTRTAVLTLGVASGQYSCPRLNTTWT